MMEEDLMGTIGSSRFLRCGAFSLEERVVVRIEREDEDIRTDEP